LAFFKVVWHEKMFFWHVRHALAIFDGVGMKKQCLAFFKTSVSVTAVGLEL